jgi:hypothetical protein
VPTCNSVKSAWVQCRAPKNGRMADSVEETEQFCSDSPCRPAYDFRERSRGSQGALERNLSVRPEQTVWPPLSRNRAKLSDRHLLARLRRIGLQVTGRPRRSTASAGRIDRGKSRSDSSGVPRAQVSAQARTRTFLSLAPLDAYGSYPYIGTGDSAAFSSHGSSGFDSGGCGGGG